MHKIVIHRRGGYDRLVLEPHDVPNVSPHDVHVQVHAAGVNYADCIVRMGLYSSAKEYVGWPITPGFEAAGVVQRTGTEVKHLRPGDEVVVVTRFGGYATDIVVPARQVFPIPRGLTMTEAAAFPAVYLTAYHAAVMLARPPAGARVLVHSAAGGVGSALVQICRLLDCRVVGVVGGSHKIEHVRALGASDIIDRSQGRLWPEAEAHAPAGYDVVFDANGVDTLGQSLRHLAPMGRLVVYGFASMLPRANRRMSWLRLAWHWLRTPRISPFELTDRNRSVMGFNLSYMFDHNKLLTESMDQISRWLESGVVRPPVVSTFPLAAAGEAQRALETGNTVGKLVLVTEHGTRAQAGG
jgi:NADPH:quinone reductase-like Zn-dependent oxidoreductase